MIPTVTQPNPYSAVNPAAKPSNEILVLHLLKFIGTLSKKSE